MVASNLRAGARLLLLAAASALAGCANAPGPVLIEGSARVYGEVMELTHDAAEGCVFWPTADEFGLEEVADGETEGGRHHSASSISPSVHGGTQRHFADGGPLRIVAHLPRS